MTEHNTRLRSPKMRDRMLDRIDSSDDERGFVLIFVLILSVALITMLTFAVSSSVGNLTNAANFSNVNQGQNSAMSGLSAATNAMATAGSITALPCTAGTPTSPISMVLPRVKNANATYSVTIVYFPAGTGPTCNGGNGTAPTSAVLTSTGAVRTSAGTVLHGIAPVVMQETMTIAAIPGSLTSPFTYALLSQGTLTLQKGLTVVSPSSCIGPNGTTVPAPCGDVYGNVINTCQNNSLIQGSVQVGTALVATLTIGNQCEVTSDIYVDGDVILNNSAVVDGSIHAYGGNVTLNNSSSVGRNIYASAIAGVGGGTINIDTNHCLCNSVGGSLYAATAITATIGGTAQPVVNLLPLLQVFGSVNFPYASGSMPGPPATVTLPQLNPTALTLAASKGDTGGDLYHVICIGGSSQPGCTSFQSSCSTFQATATVPYSVPTAIYAPTCVVVTNGNSTFNLGSNEVWVVGGFSEGGSLTVQASLPTNTYDLSVIVAVGGSCPSADLDLNGNTFAVSVKVALFTPCNVNIIGDQIIDGQILAGGNITTTGNFTLNFDQSASAYLPGAYGAPVPTPTVTGKTVING